jgi:hypothetical protein
VCVPVKAAHRSGKPRQSGVVRLRAVPVRWPRGHDPDSLVSEDVGQAGRHSARAVRRTSDRARERVLIAAALIAAGSALIGIYSG